MKLLLEQPRIKFIQQIAKKSKVQVYLVGGFVRDYMLGLKRNDLDFAVSRNALKLAQSFAKKIKGAYIELDAQRGCARVAKKIKGELHCFDFSDYRAKTIEGDLALRDFTVNTLVVDINKYPLDGDFQDHIQDYKRALKDIEAKRIKRVSVKSIKDDPLRILRAFSLQANTGFRMELSTLNQIRKDKDRLLEASEERIREEFFKILESHKTFEVIKNMDKHQVLDVVLPQIKVMYKCHQGSYHHLDVWPHSLEALRQFEKVVKKYLNHEDMQEYLNEIIGGGHSRLSLIKFAILLHDIGKPETKKKEPEGRLSFHSHEHVGAKISRSICRMLKVSTKEQYVIEDMVRWHLRPGYLSNFKSPTKKAIYRYFRDTKDEAASILLLSMADQKATCGPKTSYEDQKHHEKICTQCIDTFFEKKKEKPFVLLISGKDLIKTLKLKPSPFFKKVLAEVEEQQVLGKVKTKKDAIQLAKKVVEK